ncbi:MAG TPA: S41 family peptidase [Allosphingosinicella sp.]
MKIFAPFAAAGLLACASLLGQLANPAAVAAPADAQPESALPAAEAKAAALELAGMLEEGYVFPDTARSYAAALRARAAAGDYDTPSTAAAFAERLTADLRAVSPDNHLRVMVGAPGTRGQPSAPPPGRRPFGPPIEDAREIAPGIAYIRFAAFLGSDEEVEAARKFMSDHLDAKTIIFDIRTHRGGGLAEMDAMLPYLFSKPTTLVTMDTRLSVDRAGGNPLAEEPTLRRIATDEDVARREHFVTPHPTEKRLFDAKVILLTSNVTASAAEHFSLAMKRTGRATLIGETTGGAGHYGGVRPLAGKFGVFIPVGRTFDPDTGKGWEGTGVAPHVAVPAEQALVEALVRSGVGKAEAERLSAEIGPKGPFVRQRPRA